MRPFLIRWIVTTIAVWAASAMGFIHFDSDGSLLVAALILGIVNAVIRPVLLLLSLPFVLLTLGIGIFIVNALLLLCVSGLVPGFHVVGFGNAFFAAIIISFVSWIMSSFLRSEGRRLSFRVIRTEDGGMKRAQGRVIE